MRILLTGCAGFIGWKTAEMLLEAGNEVVGIDNLNDYYDPRLKQWRLEQIRGRAGFHFVEGDIENLDTLRRLFRHHAFDAVINLAARAGVRASLENPHIYLTTNAHGTLNLLELMREFKVAKFVLASTSSLYAGLPMPFTEDLPVNQPISPYAASKKAAEVMAYTYHALFGIDVSVVRYFTVFGPAGRPDMSPLRFTRWIDRGEPIVLYGDGSYTRDFTYIDDIARGTVLALKPLGYEIINLGGGLQPLSIREMISILERLLGKRAMIDQRPADPSDMPHTSAEISKAARLLNWKPRVSPQEGLARLVEWYCENRGWLEECEL